jgi:hypothetical protein
MSNRAVRDYSYSSAAVSGAAVADEIEIKCLLGDWMRHLSLARIFQSFSIDVFTSSMGLRVILGILRIELSCQ